MNDIHALFFKLQRCVVEERLMIIDKLFYEEIPSVENSYCLGCPRGDCLFQYDHFHGASVVSVIARNLFREMGFLSFVFSPFSHGTNRC